MRQDRVACAHGDVLGGPRSDPTKAHQVVPELARIGAGVDDDLASVDRTRQGDEGMPASRGHGERTRLAFGQLDQRRRCGEEMGDRRIARKPVGALTTSARPHALPDGQDEFAGDGPPARHGDLLADHRAHGEFEAVHRARDPPARVVADQRSEEGVVAQCLDHRDRVGVEVEQAAAPLHRRGEIAQVRELKIGHDAVLVAATGARRRVQRHDPATKGQAEAAPVVPAVEGFDPRERPLAEEGEEG